MSGEDKKKVDVDTKLRSIKISWLRRLFDNNYHPWKIIPLKMIEQYDKSLILHSNFSFSRDHQFCMMPPFYLEILQIWSEATSQTPTGVEQMLSQSLWFHNSILIDKKPVYFPRMSQCGFNKVKDLFDQSGKPFTQARIQEMQAPPDVYFKYMQLLHAIPNTISIVGSHVLFVC